MEIDNFDNLLDYIRHLEKKNEEYSKIIKHVIHCGYKVYNPLGNYINVFIARNTDEHLTLDVEDEFYDYAIAEIAKEMK